MSFLKSLTRFFSKYRRQHGSIQIDEPELDVRVWTGPTPPAPKVVIPYRGGPAEWLGYPYKKAKYQGYTRSLSEITGVIIHRLAHGRFDAGVRYVQNPDPRKVSWHVTIGENKICRHAPLSRVTHHCRYPNGTNRQTIGIEIEGPMDSPISDATHVTLREVVRVLQTLCPSLRYIASHSYMDRTAGKRKSPRRDPGKELDWTWLEGLGLELLK